MATTINATIQFKRGSKARWEQLNPILLAGEPGYVKDTGEIKIGDGTTPWKQLPCAFEKGIYNAPTSQNFPSVGKSDVIYKAEEEKALYQWNSLEQKYELLNSLDIDFIDGNKTIVVLKNNSTLDWANQTEILSKGELAIEFLDNGKVKIKIGNGIDSWENLNYFGSEIDEDSEVLKEINQKIIKLENLITNEENGLIKEVNNLKLELNNNQVEINTIKQIIGAAATDEEEATGIFAELDKKVNYNEVYLKQDTEKLIASMISDSDHLSRKIVEDIDSIVLTAEDADKYIYMVPKEDSDGYDEYMVINDQLEKVGDWSVDLSDYATIQQVQNLEKEINNIKEVSITEKEIQKQYKTIKYEITNCPEGSLIDYRDKEIRVMVPKDTVWNKQAVGAEGNPNMYYMAFKAYAPIEADSFKEDTKIDIEDQTIYYFENNPYAGIDEYGRKYSICWLALASYDESLDSWTYFGKNSTLEKYIGWYYSVEWYDKDGKIIGSDVIRINLSNEQCHKNIEPYYMSKININKLFQEDDDVLILYGGSASDNII